MREGLMRKFFCFIIMFFLLLTSCGKRQEINSLEKIIERDYIIAGVKQDAFPFGYLNEENEYAGFDIDIAKYAAKKILGSENKVKFVSVTPNTRIGAITSNEVDMVIATMSDTQQRRYLIDFSIPYYVAGQTAVVKNNSKIYTFSDLKDKTTLIVLGTTSEQNLRRIIPTARIVGYENYTSVFQALKDGKGDAVSTDDTIISGFLAQNKGYRVLHGRLSSEPYAIGIKKTEDKILQEKLNSIVNEMRNDGTLKALKKKWKLI